MNNYYKYNPFNNLYNNQYNYNLYKYNKNKKIIDMNNFQNKNYTNSNLKSKDNKLNFLNFNFESEDILLIGLIIFLVLQKEKDYILIIIIGLMILNLSINDLKDLKFFKDLTNLI